MSRTPFVAAAFAFVLAACAGTPTETFHTLSVTVPSGSVPAIAALPDLAIAIDRIALPDIVDRPQFVLRTGPNQVRILEQQRWAEPLRSAIPRVVAEDLGLLLGSGNIFAYPRDPPAEVRYRVALDIATFEARQGESVTIDAAWTVRTSDGGPIRAGRTLAEEPAREPGLESLVRAQGRALHKVSLDIAQAVMALSGSR